MNKAAETRFVTLQHRQSDGSHFDLMILCDDQLATWKFVHPPESAAPSDCQRLPDHRKLYLDYEGPVSNDRGDVTRHDQGPCTIFHWSEDRIELDFQGSKLCGRYGLTRGSDQRWGFAPLE